MVLGVAINRFNKIKDLVKLKFIKMGKLDIKASIEINASAETAWEIVGPNFINIGDWGPGINKSWNN